MLLGYGATIEILQLAIPYRECSGGDFAADAAGIVAGIAIAKLSDGGIRQRLLAEYPLKFE